jgi:hypothetical protein
MRRGGKVVSPELRPNHENNKIENARGGTHKGVSYKP